MSTVRAHTPTEPDREQFIAAYNDGRAQTVHTAIISDLETPVSAYLKLTDAGANSFLLESVEGGETLGRYSIIGMDPDLKWTVQDGVAIQTNLDTDGNVCSTQTLPGPPLDSFEQLISQSAIPGSDALPPMAAGIFGMFGYDMVREREHLPGRKPDPFGLPTASLIRPRLVAVFDNIKHQLTLVSPVYPDAEQTAENAYAGATARLDAAIKRLNRLPPDIGSATAQEHTDDTAITASITKTGFLENVARAKEYIRAGDIFQVVLSQRFSRTFRAPPFSLYRSLRRENPSPFLFYFDLDGFSLAGSSPEILVRVQNNEITIRPIAGTRRRGASVKEDQALADDLLADEKERAEHLMLLDLGRNDVGRAAEIGSVRVTDSFFIERYSHVMHMVSNVVGQLRKGASALDAMMAGFPAGTVSGAPKIRAMEIIDEMETEGRGPYAGAIGYFSASGAVDTAITLRTGLVHNGKLHVQAGAGIVADSDPEAEYQECINKARAVFAAAEKV